MPKKNGLPKISQDAKPLPPGAGARAWRVQDVARYFDVKRQAVYKWIYAGQLPVYKTPGGGLRFIESEVRAFAGDTAAEEILNLPPVRQPTQTVTVEDKRLDAILIELAERLNTLTRDVATMAHLAIATNEQIMALAEAQARTDEQMRLLMGRNGDATR